MYIKRNTTVEKGKNKKTGDKGDERYEAHRLEGLVKNKAIKPVKKEKREEITSTSLDKNHNPDKISKELKIEPID